MSWEVIHGSCLETLKTLANNSVDSIVTDPPYGLGKLPDPEAMLRAWLAGDVYDPGSGGFMGRKWDSFIPGPHYWREAIRVLRPGGHILCFAGTRTADLMGLALRLGGFEIRDTIEFAYGSGFPKSLNLVDGLGTALKPSHEPVILARKPVTQTIAANVLEYGTGAINIDACRVEHANPEDLAKHKAQVDAIRARGGSMADSWKNSSDLSGASEVTTKGRWPANFLLQHSENCVKTGIRKVVSNPTWDTPNRECESTFTGKEVSRVRHADTAKDFHMQAGEPIFEETVADWDCVAGCPVKLMDDQSADDGDESAARYFQQFEIDDFDLNPFFYCPKPSRAERDIGLAEFAPSKPGDMLGLADNAKGLNSPRAGAGRKGGSRNIHPTVKSIALMRYLVRLVTPKGGTVLDPFCGSGSTGCAAVLEGFNFIGCELNDTEKEPFVSIARARIAYVQSAAYLSGKKTPSRTPEPTGQTVLPFA